MFTSAFTRIRELPIAQRPLTTADEVEAVGEATKQLISRVAGLLKKPGNAAVPWTYVALACFLAATAALVVDFELSSRPPMMPALVAPH